MLLSSVLLAASLSAAPPRPFTQGPSVEGITEYGLPNGLKVLLIPDASTPQVTVNLTVFVGSRNEDYGEHGMAHLFEHMLFKKTKKVPDVKKALAALGGMANGTTWFDRTNYFETFPADPAKLRTALQLESQRLSAAIISREQLATEMTVVRNEFEMGESDPHSVLSERVESVAFDWHNYGQSTIGPRSDIENVPNERLQAFYAKYYAPDNAMLVVAGKFDEAQTLAWIAQEFASIPKSKIARVPTYTAEPTQDGERSVTLRRVGGTPLLDVVYHVPAGTDPQFPAVDVLAKVLGDAPSGRLYQALVDTKKAASVSCYDYTLKEPGLMHCTAELNAGESTAPAREALLATLEGAAKKPFSAEEVERAKASLAKDYEGIFSASDRIAMAVSESAAGGDWRMLLVARDATTKVTPDDVNKVAAQLLKPSNRTLGEYVPTPAPDRAEIAGPVDLAKLLSEYKPAAAREAGEAFDASPKNIDARTHLSTLPSGMKLALLPKKTRGGTVHFAIDLRFGSLASLTNQQAAASFVEGMLTRGTTKLTRQQFDDALAKLQAQVNFNVGTQTVSVVGEVRRAQLLDTLALVFDALRAPAMSSAEFETLRREVLAQLEQMAADPMAVGQTQAAVRAHPYPVGHPLAVRSIDAQTKDARGIKLDDVKAFHARFFGAQDSLVSVVGDFDEAELTRALAANANGFVAREKYVRIPRPYQAISTGKEDLVLADKAGAFLGAVHSVQITDHAADYPALVMADFMLGGGFLSGRVPQRLREKDGFCYGAGTQLQVDDEDDFARFFAYAIFAPENTNKVEAGLLEELQRALKDGFTADELKAAKEGWQQGQLTSLADDAAIASTWADYMRTGRTFAYDADLQSKVAALKLDDVNAALRKYIDGKKLAIVRSGDLKKAGPAAR